MVPGVGGSRLIRKGGQMKLLLVEDDYPEDGKGHAATFRVVEKILAAHDDAWIGEEIRHTVNFALAMLNVQTVKDGGSNALV
jgi:hypothetical protein